MLILVLLLVIVILLLALCNYFYNVALNARASKSFVLSAPHNIFESPNKNNPSVLKGSDWFESVDADTLTVKSFDSLTLSAWVKESSGHKWAVICHGYCDSSNKMSYAAKWFMEQGYGFVVPDARGHGKSDGKYIGMGWHDRLDCLKWVDYILQKDTEAEIVLFGVSMGGATVMMTAGETLPSNIRLVIEDCGYTSIKDEFSYQVRKLYHIHPFPLLNIMSLITKLRADFFLGEGDSLRQIKKARIPIMFIHGEADTFVPCHMQEKLFNAVDIPKKKLLVQGAGHGMSVAVLQEEYWREVESFIDENW